MILVVPVQAVPAQQIQVLLNGQQTTIILRSRLGSIFIDVYVNDAPIVNGVICQNKNVVVRDQYLGFLGDLAFYDTQGSDDPVYTGLGSRWPLYYLLPASWG